MNLLTNKTPRQTALDLKDDAVLTVAEAAHHLAATIRHANARFWRLPTAVLLDALNADVPVTLATFAANTALGLAVNASLDALDLPEFPTRTPVEMGRADITFDGTAFVFVPPQEHSTAPEPPADPPAAAD